MIRDYQASIETSRKAFNDINNETTTRGATPAAFMGNQAGPDGWEPTAYSIFNDWGATILKELAERKRKGTLTEMFASQASFDQFFRELLSSLEDFWTARAHPDFPVSRKQLHKLVNLFVKWLRTKVPAEVRALIEQHGHTTLNTPTLARIGALLGDDTLQFPADEDFDGWYAGTQQRIRAFAEEHGSSPIIVDVWCRSAYLGEPDEDA